MIPVFNLPSGINQDIFSNNTTFIYDCNINLLNNIDIFEFIMKVVYDLKNVDPEAINKFERFLDRINDSHIISPTSETSLDVTYITDVFGGFKTDDEKDTYLYYKISFNVPYRHFRLFTYIYKKYKEKYYKLLDDRCPNQCLFAMIVLDDVTKIHDEFDKKRKED